MLITDPPAEITENLLMLGSKAYPIFLVTDGQEAAIFEGGVGAVGPLVLEQLRSRRIDGDSIKQVVITHAHPDHVMAVPLFKETFPNATLVASGVAAKTLAAEKAIAMFRQLDEAVTASLIEQGTLTEENRPKPFEGNQIAVDRIVKEGDKIKVGSLSFDVLETLGHSPCSLSFFEPMARVLLISDVTGFYMPNDDSWWPCYFGDYAAYVGSIRRMAELEAEVLCLSHNGTIKGAGEVKGYFEKAIAVTEQYHERIVDERKAGKSVRQIAEQLGSEIFEKTKNLPVDFFQKNCGILVKQSLRHEGISLDK